MERSSKDKILESLRNSAIEVFPKPEIKIEAIRYTDKVAQFKSITEGVGGMAEELQPGESLNDAVKRIFPDAKQIISNLPKLTCATINPDQVAEPSQLNGSDLVVCRGLFGVCENGAIYYEQDTKQRAAYFIAEAMLILLDKNELVDNMHDAYRRIPDSFTGEFRGFVSGPSKTADIEQALVKGAHGPRQTVVLLV